MSNAFTISIFMIIHLSLLARLVCISSWTIWYCPQSIFPRWIPPWFSEITLCRSFFNVFAIIFDKILWWGITKRDGTKYGERRRVGLFRDEGQKCRVCITSRFPYLLNVLQHSFEIDFGEIPTNPIEVNCEAIWFGSLVLFLFPYCINEFFFCYLFFNLKFPSIDMEMECFQAFKFLFRGLLLQFLNKVHWNSLWFPSLSLGNFSEPCHIPLWFPLHYFFHTSGEFVVSVIHSFGNYTSQKRIKGE